MLGGLEFVSVRGQVDELKAVGDAEARFCVPAGAVEEQEDGAALACTRLVGEYAEQALEERLGDAVADIPVALAGGWCHEGG